MNVHSPLGRAVLAAALIIGISAALAWLAPAYISTETSQRLLGALLGAVVVCYSNAIPKVLASRAAALLAGCGPGRAPLRRLEPGTRRPGLHAGVAAGADRHGQPDRRRPAGQRLAAGRAALLPQRRQQLPWLRMQNANRQGWRCRLWRPTDYHIKSSGIWKAAYGSSSSTSVLALLTRTTSAASRSAILSAITLGTSSNTPPWHTITRRPATRCACTAADT